MAKKPVSSKRVPKPAAAKTGPNRTAGSGSKRPVTRALVKKPAPASNGQGNPKPAASESRSKSVSSLEASLRQLDRQILQLINRRAEITTRLVESAPNRLAAVFNLHADDQLWQELTTTNPGPLPNAAVRGVFRQILSAARQKVKTQRVAYLGPPFSFTHLAAIERFGESADLIPVSTIASVFEEVNRGHADFGIVPIENSTDGRIVDTLDMFTRLPLRICGEVQIAVHHNLASKSPRSEITEVYSKPQALSQCREWLSRNMPHARLIEVTSTSTAAQLARDKPGVGAVASRQAAVEYDLQIVAESIEDNANNVTRFAVIGEHETKPTGQDRTAVLLQIPHKPGSLSDALQAFKRNKLNLTWIESFPLRGPESGYLFFIDFEGHISEGRTKRTLEELEGKAVRLEVLGSYPRSETLE
jgi:chorismate mutase / prephenate dehydratase